MTAVEQMTERDGWLEWRRGGVGASEVAALVNASPWSTPYQVWLSKVEGVDVDESEPMLWGTLLEPVIIGEYERRTGRRVIHRQLQVVHSDHSHHRCTLDGASVAADGLGEFEGLEVKNVSDRRWHEVPLYYWTQAQWQMWCTGFRSVTFAVLHAGTSLELYEVDRDDEDIYMLVAAVDRFWRDHVETKQPPVIVGRDLDVVRERHVGSGDVVADDVVLTIIEAHRAAKDTAKDAEDYAAELAAKLIARLTDAGADVFVDAAGVPVWSYKATREFDVSTAARDHPDIAALVTAPAVDVAAFKKALGKKGVETYMRPSGSRRIDTHTRRK